MPSAKILVKLCIEKTAECTQCNHIFHGEVEFRDNRIVDCLFIALLNPLYSPKLRNKHWFQVIELTLCHGAVCNMFAYRFAEEVEYNSIFLPLCFFTNTEFRHTARFKIYDACFARGFAFHLSYYVRTKLLHRSSSASIK